MTQSRQRTKKTLTWIQDQFSCTPQTLHNGTRSSATAEEPRDVLR